MGYGTQLLHAGIVQSTQGSGGASPSMEDDYSGYSTGSLPAGLTEEWDTSGYTATIESDAISNHGGQALQIARTANSRTLIQHFSSNSDVVEAVGIVRSDTLVSSGGNIIGPALCTSGSAGSESGYFSALNYHGSNGLQLNIGLYDGGAFTAVQGATFSWAANTWYRIRFRIDRSSSPVVLRAKIWEEGASEPGSWGIDTTTSTNLGGDGVGIFSFGDTDTQTMTLFSDFLSYAEEGASAALPS